MRIVAGIAMLLLLFVRGFVLWFLIPFSVVGWLLVEMRDMKTYRIGLTQLS